jgi:O-antigen/teichoic acid export membrane protein
MFDWRTILTGIKQPQSFVRNVSISSFWNILIILIQFALSPIISRIYSPAEYGLYSIFSSLVFNISLIGTLKYGEAIVLQQSRVRKNQLIAVSLVLTFLTTFSTVIVFLIFGEAIGLFLKDPDIVPLLFYVPLAIIINGVFDIMLSLNITEKLFFRNGVSGLTYHLISRLISIGLGVTQGPKTVALIFGEMGGRLFGLTMLAGYMSNFGVRIKNFIADFRWADIWDRIIEYKSFPFYFLPSSLLIIASNHLPLYFFQLQFGSSMVGSFGMANSILEIVNRVIPYSIAPVLLQKVNEMRDKPIDEMTGKIKTFFTWLLTVSTFIFCGFALFSEVVFPFVLGPNWRTAGQFSSILAAQFLFNFVAVALSGIFNVMNSQKTLLKLTFLGLLLKLLAMAVVYQLQLSASSSLLYLSLIGALSSIAIVIGLFILINALSWREVVLMVVAFVAVFLCYLASVAF